jgi:hypothetical protein
MSEHILDIDQLEFREFSEGSNQAHGIQLCDLDLTNCILTLVRYLPGANIPRHSHTKRVISVILRGEMTLSGARVGPGSLVECDGPYGPRVVEEEVLLLVIQPKGSEYVPMG